MNDGTKITKPISLSPESWLLLEGAAAMEGSSPGVVVARLLADQLVRLDLEAVRETRAERGVIGYDEFRRARALSKPRDSPKGESD